MRMQYLLILGFSCFVFSQVPAQEADSLAVIAKDSIPLDSLGADSLTNDTILPKKKRQKFFKWILSKEDYPSPKKALIFSLVVPGSGQIYNKKYWKLPIVYGALGGLVYLADFNSKRYKRFRRAYESSLAGEMHEFSNTSIDDPQSLKAERDEARRNMEQAYIFLFFGYALNGIDALVDAHLMQFNVSDELSLKLAPTMESFPLSIFPSVGVGIKLELK